MEIESESRSTSDSIQETPTDLKNDFDNDSEYQSNSLEKKFLFERSMERFMPENATPTYTPQEYEQIIKNNIDYEHYVKYNPYDIDQVDELVNCMLDVVCTDTPTVKIGRENKSRALARAVYMKIDSSDVDHVLKQYKDQFHKIKHKHAYLKTMLYNTKQELSAYYTNAVRADGVISR